MDKKIMDTQELREIRALIGDIDETPPAKKQAPPPRQRPRQPEPSPAPQPRRSMPRQVDDADVDMTQAVPRPVSRQAEPQRRQPAPQGYEQPRPRQQAPGAHEEPPRQRRQAPQAYEEPPRQRRQAPQEYGQQPRPRQQAPQAYHEPQPRQPRQAAPGKMRPENAYNVNEIVSEISGVVERGADEKAHETKRPRARHVQPEEPRGRTGDPRRSASGQSRKPRVVPISPEYEEEARSAPRERRGSAAYPGEDDAPEKSSRARRRAAREANRVTTEEAEDIVLRHPRQAQATCARRSKSLGSRSLLVLMMALAALYLTLAPGLGMPLPPALNFSEQPTTTVLAMLLTQFIAMFAGIDVVGLGFYNLFSAKPDRRSLVSVAMLASLLHGITIIIAPAWNAYLPYCAISVILLFAIMIEERNRLAARCRVFKAVSLSDNPILVYSHWDEEDRVHRALKYQSNDNSEFLRELERPDYAERFSSFYVPVALAAAAVLSLISAFSNNDPSRFFLSFSVMLSVGAPLGILCAAGSPYKNVSRRLLGDGAAIAGARGANRLRASKEVILNDTDLFPAGSISIQGITNYGMYTDEKLLAYAAAVTNEDGLELGRVFAEELHRGYGRPVRASRILHYESGGISGEIGGDSVMLGTAAFLARMGIHAKEAKSADNGVFIAINSYPAGVFNLQYHPSAQAYGGIHTMKRAGVTPFVAATDFNISPAMISNLFELRQGAVGEVPSERAALYRNPDYVAGDTPGALLSRNSITPYANVFLCADKLAGVVRSNLILGGFAGISGMLIMFYLTYLAEYAAISPQNILLYLLLWYIPVLIISYGTRRLQ